MTSSSVSSGGESPRKSHVERWAIDLICCGRSDGVQVVDGWDAADAFRESYCTGVGTKGHLLTPNGHERQAIVRHPYPDESRLGFHDV